jgi:predicted nucleic acid-binding protein
VNLVLDASIAASWLLKRSDPKELLLAQRAVEWVQRHEANVPAIFYPELTNALLIAERRGFQTPISTTKFLADLASMSISPDPFDLETAQKTALNLARTLQLTTYDATYLELAQRSNGSLATFDRKLAEAARSAGIPIFGDIP